MNRPLLLIASRSACVTSALCQYVELFIAGAYLPHHLKAVTFSCFPDLVQTLDELRPEQLRDTMVVLDISGEREDLWTVHNFRFDRGIAAQLVLSYPEIYFVFVSPSGTPTGPKALVEPDKTGTIAVKHHFVSANRMVRVLELVQLHAEGFRTIFDATALRSILKDQLQTVGDDHARMYSTFSESRKTNAAVSADEESAFVYLNGYVAYKAGFRSWLLSTKEEFTRILPLRIHTTKISAAAPHFERKEGPREFAVVLSDWELVYPDYEESEMDPEAKYLLNQIEFLPGEQLVVITGYQVKHSRGLLSFFEPLFSKLYSAKSRDDEETRGPEALCKEHNGFTLSKPYGGIFDLLREPKRNLLRKPKRNRNKLWDVWETRKKVPTDRRWSLSSLVRVWGTRKSVSTTTRKPPSSSSHSAPYARSIVVSRLLSRVRSIRAEGPQDIESWVQMALLAGEAKEILGGLSRTTAYEAIALQNEAEVGAEVSFFGTSATIEVDQRIDEIEREGGLIQAKLSPRERDTAYLNFLLQTVKNLRLRFSEFEQSEAAEKCLCKFAKFQRRLRPLWKRWPSTYLDAVTKAGTSVTRLLLCSVGWILVFWLVYSVLLLSHPDRASLSQPVISKSVITDSSDNRNPVLLTEDKKRTDNDTLPQVSEPDSTPGQYLTEAMFHSILSFLELQPGLSDDNLLKLHQTMKHGEHRLWWMPTFRIATIAELVIAYLHLGLLVSLLYRRITHRAP